MSGRRATWRQNAFASGIPTPLLKFSMPSRCIKQLHVFAISYNFPKEELCFKCRSKAGIPSIRELETWTWSANVENQTNYFLLYVFHISVSATWTRIYDMWPCNANVKPIATCSDFSRWRTSLRNKNKKTTFYARGNRETNFIHYKCPVLWWLICAMSYYCVFGAKRRKGATRKPAKWWLFRVFAWRPFAPPHESTTLFMRRLFVSCLSYLGGAKGRNAKTRHNHLLAGFRVATFRVFAPKTLLYDMA